VRDLTRPDLRGVCGIYVIRIRREQNIPLFYIGQTQDMHRRWGEHVHATRVRMADTYLYRALRKYGLENAEMYPVWEGDAGLLDYMEQQWIEMHAKLFPDQLINSRLNPAQPRGHRWTQEARERASIARKGMRAGTRRPNTSAAISAGLRGKKKSEEHVRNMSLSRKGRPRLEKRKRIARICPVTGRRVREYDKLGDVRMDGFVPAAASRAAVMGALYRRHYWKLI
jgi:hypothetical protein